MNGKEFEKKVFKLQTIIDKNRDEIEKLKSELQNISSPNFDKKRIFKRIELIDNQKVEISNLKRKIRSVKYFDFFSLD